MRSMHLKNISLEKHRDSIKKVVFASEQSERGNLKEKRYLQAGCHVSTEK